MEKRLIGKTFSACVEFVAGGQVLDSEPTRKHHLCAFQRVAACFVAPFSSRYDANATTNPKNHA